MRDSLASSSNSFANVKLDKSHYYHLSLCYQIVQTSQVLRSHICGDTTTFDYVSLRIKSKMKRSSLPMWSPQKWFICSGAGKVDRTFYDRSVVFPTLFPYLNVVISLVHKSSQTLCPIPHQNGSSSVVSIIKYLTFTLVIPTPGLCATRSLIQGV